MPVRPNPMSYCPGYESCSSPKCPLDPEIEKRIRFPGEPKCKSSKNRRRKAWAEMPVDYQAALPYQGWTKTEWVGRQTWDAMTPEQRAERISHRPPIDSVRKPSKLTASSPEPVSGAVPESREP